MNHNFSKQLSVQLCVLRDSVVKKKVQSVNIFSPQSRREAEVTQRL